MPPTTLPTKSSAWPKPAATTEPRHSRRPWRITKKQSRRMDEKDIKSVYFAGAGGIGMSALVRYFLSRGLTVAG